MMFGMLTGRFPATGLIFRKIQPFAAKTGFLSR